MTSMGKRFVPRDETWCLPQKVLRSLIDVVIHRPVGHEPRTVTEVVRPRAQHAIELLLHLVPRRLPGHFTPRLIASGTRLPPAYSSRARAPSTFNGSSATPRSSSQ